MALIAAAAWLAAGAWAAPATTSCHPTVDGLGSSDPRLRGPAVIVVRKADRRLQVFSNGASVACFPVALAAGYVPGPKVKRGDLRTPEGWYRTSDRPWSQFYGAITVHYPNTADADRGLAAGRIDAAQRDAIAAAEQRGVAPPMDTALGGLIVIHGGGSSPDWTLGCVALDNSDIDVVRSLLPPSQSTDVLLLP